MNIDNRPTCNYHGLELRMRHGGESTTDRAISHSQQLQPITTAHSQVVFVDYRTRGTLVLDTGQTGQ
jgi:hypothetical protein